MKDYVLILNYRTAVNRHITRHVWATSGRRRHPRELPLRRKPRKQGGLYSCKQVGDYDIKDRASVLQI